MGTSTGRGLTPAAAPSPARVERVQPLAVDRFKVQLTVSRATRDKLERVQALCTYVDPESGQRCGERRWLQIDHIVPRCRGGMPTPDNTRLLCGGHNRLMAREILGDAFMDQKLAQANP